MRAQPDVPVAGSVAPNASPRPVRSMGRRACAGTWSSLTFLDKLIFAVFALVSMGAWAELCITHVSAGGRSG